MLQGIDLSQRIEFSSKEDTGETKTVFVFRPLSGAEMIDLTGMFDANNLKLTGKAIIDFIDGPLVEVKNFVPDMPKRQILETLNPNILSELVNKVTEINNITAQDKKK